MPGTDTDDMVISISVYSTAISNFARQLPSPSRNNTARIYTINLISPDREKLLPFLFHPLSRACKTEAPFWKEPAHNPYTATLPLFLKVTRMNLRSFFFLFFPARRHTGHSMASVLWHASGSSFASHTSVFLLLLLLLLEPRATTGMSIEQRHWILNKVHPHDWISMRVYSSGYERELWIFVVRARKWRVWCDE